MRPVSRFQIPSIKYFLMWDRAIFSKYNTSAYHIDYVLENLDGSVAVQIRRPSSTASSPRAARR